MDYETLPWKPRPGLQVSNDPTSISANFGDGYQEVAASGLNYNLKQYQFTFRIIGQIENKRFVDFVERHGSHKAFYAYSYSRMKNVLVRMSKCSENINIGAGYCDYNMTVKEVAL